MGRGINSATTLKNQQVYQSYLMRSSPFNGTIAISKPDRRGTTQYVGYAKDFEAARAIIDVLIGRVTSS